MKYDNQYIVCDVETGGLPAKLKKRATLDVALTEIAFVVVSNPELDIIEKKSWLIKPYDPNLIYEEEAAKVSGISKYMCEKEGQPIDIVFREICDLLKKHRKGKKLPILVGHNLKNFDLEFIENLFELHKAKPLDYFDPNVEDTLEWMRKKMVESSSFNLPTCTNMVGIEHVQAHRALPDTIVTAKLWIHLLKCLRGQGVTETKKRLRDTYKFQF